MWNLNDKFVKTIMYFKQLVAQGVPFQSLCPTCDIILSVLERIISLYNPEIIPASQLGLRNMDPVASGAEKLVYKTEYRERPVATKIFRTVNDGSEIRQNRQRAAIREFGLYKSFKQTPIGIFVPDVIGLITDGSQNIPVGIAVQWIDGEHVGETEESLTSQDVDLLESTLLKTVKMGIYPNMDMYSNANLLFTPKEKQRLWFAECATTGTKYIARYMRMLQNSMDDLREFVWKSTWNSRESSSLGWNIRK